MWLKTVVFDPDNSTVKLNRLLNFTFSLTGRIHTVNYRVILFFANEKNES